MPSNLAIHPRPVYVRLVNTYALSYLVPSMGIPGPCMQQTNPNLYQDPRSGSKKIINTKKITKSDLVGEPWKSWFKRERGRENIRQGKHAC